MTLTTIYYGRYRTSPEADFGNTVAGKARACVFNAPAQNMWVTKLGVWGGKNTSTNVTLHIGLYNVSSNAPSTLDGSVGPLTASVSKTNATGGAASVGTLSTPLMLYTTSTYGIGFLSTVAGYNHSMRQAAFVTATNENFYNRTGQSSLPSPFSSTDTTFEGHLTVWAEGYANVAPNAPASLSPSGNITTTTPTLTANFQDLNGGWGTANGGVDTGDYMNLLWIQVRTQGSSTADKWDAAGLVATSAERSANAFTRAYGGTTLVRGTTYEWRAKVSDRFAEESAWTSWVAFTPSSLGVVTLDGTPTGKTDDDTPDFQGRWNHETSLSTNAVKIQLQSAGGAVLATSGWITKTVASSALPGTLFTITWAESGFSALSWGTPYQYRIQGRDTSNNEGSYSSLRSFTTNHPPSVPTSLSPTDSAIITSYPILRCSITDEDDTSATGLTATARIKNSSGTVLYSRTMTYDSADGFWKYQTTLTDLATYATYRWDATAYDGTLYSGGDTITPVYSAESVFVYALGPTVTVTSPAAAAVVATSSFTVTWTTSGQVRYKVEITDASTSASVYASGWVISGTSSHVVPSGYVRNGGSYNLLVTVENSTPLEGVSPTVPFTVSLTPPPDVSATMTAFVVGTNPWASALSLNWTQSAEPNFSTYIVRREDTNGNLVIVTRITTVTETSFFDLIPVSGIEYIYTVTQLVSTGFDEIESAGTEISGSINLGGIVISAVGTDGLTLQTSLRYTAERNEERIVEESTYLSLAGGPPSTIRSLNNYRTMQFTAKLVDDDYSTATEKRNELLTLDAADKIVCYRDNHGRRIFSKIVEMRFTDRLPGWWTVDLTLREEAYTEGVV